MAEDTSLQLDVDEDDFAIVKGDYAAVIFRNISDRYPVGAHIECTYSLTAIYKPCSRDWVALYKVGWSSPRDYITYQWAPIPPNYEEYQNNSAHVVFQSHLLPDEDGDYYQFCYIGGGQVRGASVPFQFKSVETQDFVEIEHEEEDMMIIRTKTAVLEENLEAAMKREQELEQEKKMVEHDVRALRSKLSEMDNEIEEKSERVSDTEKLLEAREKELAEISDLLHKTKEAHADLSIRASDLEKALVMKDEKIVALKEVVIDRDVEAAKLRNELSSLSEQKRVDEEESKTLKSEMKERETEMARLHDVIADLEREKETFKNHMSTTEENLKSANDEFSTLKSLVIAKEAEITKLKEQVKNLEEVIEGLKEAVDAEKKKFDGQIRKVTASQECVVHMQDKLANEKDRADAAEKCKLMLDEQMKAYIAAYEGSSRDLVDARGEIHDLKDQIKRKDRLLSERNESLAKMQTDLEEAKTEMDGCKTEVKLHEDAAKEYALYQQEAEKQREAVEEELVQMRNKVKEYEEKENKVKVQIDAATGETSLEPSVDDSASSAAALHALKMVNGHLEKRLDKKEKLLIKTTKNLSEVEASLCQKSRSENEMRKQVEDLKRRLSMGAEEYKKKWKECKKMEKKLSASRMGRHSSMGSQESLYSLSASTVVVPTHTESSQTVSVNDNIVEDKVADDLKIKWDQLKETKNKFKALYESERNKNVSLNQEIEALREMLKFSAHQAQDPSELIIVKQPASTKARPASTPETRDEAIAFNAPHTDTDDVARSSAATPPPSPILKPLPPPMIPTLMPTAKLSAVTSCFPPSPKELEKSLLSSATTVESDCGAGASAIPPLIPPRRKPASPIRRSTTPADSRRSNTDAETGIPQEPVDDAEEFYLAPELPQQAAAQEQPEQPLRSSTPEPNPSSYLDSMPDAQTSVQVCCEECSFVFPPGSSDLMIANHMQDHSDARMCPICSKAFLADQQTEYEEHVQAHFEEDVPDPDNSMADFELADLD